MSDAIPIGVFDSGVGGLSIARCLQRELPSESFLYFADQKYSPYGSKSASWLEARTELVAQFLLERGCKALVVACNTATVNSISALREKIELPIVGVEPAIKPAALHSKAGVVGVLATAQTLRAESFCTLLDKFSGPVKLVTQACPELVSLVESANLHSEETIGALRSYIEPLLDLGADHIVLGCTHFSFLRESMARVIGGRAHILDAGTPVAAELKRQLGKFDLLNASCTPGKISFYSSSASSLAAKNMSLLWGSPIELLEAI